LNILSFIRYAVNNSWFVNTMNKVFLLGGDLVRAEVANNLMRLLAEGAGGDENADNELRAQAVQSYIALCQQPVLPDILVKVIAWVLGEYAYLALEDVNQAIDSLCDLMDRPYKNSDVKNWLCWAIGKLLAYTGELRDDVKDMLMKYAICDNVELSRRCQELIVLFDVLQTATSRDVREDLNAIFPIDASCEDINVEVSIGEVVRYLSEKAVMEGGRQYVPKAKRGGAFGKVSTTVLAGGASAGGSKKLRFKYDHPAPKPAVTHIMANSPDRVEPARVSDAPAPIVTTPGKSVMSAAGPWGKTGYGLPKPTTPAAVPGAEGTYKSPTVPNHEQSPQETAYYEAAKKSAPAASPPPKVVDTKQQQLAAQLFMGLGDEVATTTSPTATVVVRKAAPLPVRSNSGTALASTRAGIARQSSAPLASPAVSDLLGGLSVSDESESHHPQPAVDLLGLDFSSAPSSSPSSPTATNVRTGSPAPPRDLLSSFDDDEVVTPSSFPAQQHSNTILSPTPGVPEFLKPAFVAARQISGTDPDNFDIENLTKTSLLTSVRDDFRFRC
jgi:AP-4 complex subunit epsilon-1